MKYRSDIDGLRALAVVPVILFHAGVAGVPGGFVGVDLFFVISGFLITSIIAKDLDDGRFSIAHFYERRVRRILPNLFAMMAATSAAALVILIPIDLGYFGQSLTAATLSLSNVLFFLKVGYFEPSASQVPLLHTWSLAVEEQYYLLFPPLMMALARGSRHAMRWAIWLLFAGSLAISIWQVGRAPTAAFYLPFGRWWELMLGSLLAIDAVPAIPTSRLREAAAAAGLAMIVAANLLFRETMPFPGYAALLPCIGTAAIIHANRAGPTYTGRLLSVRPFVATGLLSYSLYLWHWPPIVFSRYVAQRPLSPVETLAVFVVIVGSALLAWRFVERPLRRARHGWTRRRVLMLALLCTVLFAAAGIAFWRSGGLPARFDRPARDYAAGALDTNPRRDECDTPSRRRIAASDFCRIGRAAGAPTFAFIGDSEADALSPGVADVARRLGRTGIVATHPGCLPLEGARGCPGFWHATLRTIAQTPAIDTVIVAGRWSTFVEGYHDGLDKTPWRLVHDAQSGDRRGLDENRAAIARSFARTAAILNGKRLVILAYLPEQHVNAPQYLALRSRWGGSLPGLPRSVHDARQRRTRALIEVAARRDGFTVVDAGAAMCNPRECPITDGRRALYADDSHPSSYGAERFARVLAPTIAATGSVR